MYKKQWRLDNPNFFIEYTYGLTEDQYKALIANGCEMCGSLTNLHIDHDHSCCNGRRTCGKCIRGVLCAKHNRGIGFFEEDVEMLAAAIAYLNKSKSGLT